MIYIEPSHITARQAADREPAALSAYAIMARSVISAATVLVALGAAGRADATPSEGIHNIQHVIMIM
jgi:hypothetical protein